MKEKKFFILVFLMFHFLLSIVGQNISIEQKSNCVLDDAGAFSENIAPVKLYLKWGFINTHGDLITKLEYDNVGIFSNGLAPVQKNGKWGFIDKTGRLVIPNKYDDVGNFHEGLASVKMGNKWGFINTSGRIVVPIEYEPNLFDDSSIFHHFKNGYASVLYKEENKGLWGLLLDKTGKAITPKGQCGIILDMCDGLAGFSVSYLENGKIVQKWGYINNTGKVVIEPEFDYVGNFCGGYAFVEKDNKVGIINKTGRFVIPYKYDVHASQATLPNGLAVCKIGKNMVLIDMTGKELTPRYYDYIRTDKEGSTDLFVVEKDGKYGWINKNNKTIIPIKYDNICYFDGQEYTAVAINDKWGLINRIGQVVLGFNFDKLKGGDNGYWTYKIGARYGFINKLGNTISINFDKDDMYSIAKDFEIAWDGKELNKEYLKIAMEWHKKSATKGNIFACYKMGINYMDGGFFKTNYVEAVKWLEKCIDVSGETTGDEYLYLGTLYKNGGHGLPKNEAIAFKYFTDGARIKNNTECYNELAYFYAKKKNYNLALDNINKAIEKSSNNSDKANYYDSKGEIYLMMDKTDEAIQMWNKVMELDKDNIDFYIKNSELYKQLKMKGKI